MPAAGKPEGTGSNEGMGTEARLAALERLVDAMATEITTRRLVVVDDRGRTRMVAEVNRDTAELCLQLPGDERWVAEAGGRGGDAPGAPGRTGVVLYATPPDTDGDEGHLGLGPSVGLQLWAGGDSVTELDAWPDGDGRWRSHLHLTGDP